MRKLKLLFLALIAFVSANSQLINRDGYSVWMGNMYVGHPRVGVIGAPPSSVWVQFGDSATSKAMWLPRVQHLADIAAPKAGMLLYCLDSAKLFYHNGVSWTAPGTGSGATPSVWGTITGTLSAQTDLWAALQAKADTSNVWYKTGNGGTDTSVNFIGTKDLKPILFRTNNVQAGYISALSGIPAATNGTVVLGQYAGANLGSSVVHGNTLIGHAAGYNLRQSPLKSHQNTYVGLWAGYSTDTFSDPFGGRSVLVGQSTAFRNYDGSSLTYVGTFAGELNHRGNYNTGIGRDALRSNIDGNYNTSIGGLSALYGTTGIKTIAVVDSGSGYTSATVTISAPPVIGPGVFQQTATATATISGGKITGITVTNPGGGYSLSTMGLFHTTPITVTITGDGTGATASVTETQSATGNTSLGYAAGYLDKYGKYNISIGYLTTINSQFGENIVLIGTGANIGASSPSPILNSVAIGKNAKVSASNTIALGGTGADAAKVVIGAESTSVGFELVNSAGAAIDSITIDAKGLSSGQQTSLAIGIDAMRNATGVNSTAIGYKSQELFGTSSNVAHNTSVGAFTLKKVNQFGNSAFGSNSSVDITTGYRNTGIGAYTNYKVVSGKSNTGVGFWSLNENLGDYNTGLGDGSGASITTGNYNTAIGAFSMGHSTLTFFPGTAKLTGSYNTGLGITSLFNLTSGSYNTGIGNIAGSAITSGSYNVIIGSNTGSTIATANRRIIISDGEGNSRQEIDSLGNVLFTGTGGVRLTIGTTAQRPTNAAGLIRWNTDSASFEYADGISWYKIGASSGGGSMIYPGAGIPVSTGSSWGSSITDNSANWNTAYGWGDHAGLYPTISRFNDSLSSHTVRFNSITSSLASKLNISDTASMLTNYVRRQELKDTAAALRSAIGSGGGANNYPTGVTYTQSSRTLAIQRSGLSDISTTIPLATSILSGLMSAEDKARLDSNNYIYGDSTYIRLALQRNDSVLVTKSARVQLNGSSVTPTETDTTISWNIQALVAADTTNKYVTSVYRKTASDSVFFIKGGTHTFAYKDSTGSGGGTTYKIGTLNGVSPDGNGASIVSDSIYMQTYSGEFAGLVPSGSTATDVLKGNGWGSSWDDREATIRRYQATGSNTTPSTFAWGTNRVSAGTGSAQAPATTNTLTKYPRLRYTSAVTSSQVIGERYGNAHMYGTHGYEYIIYFGTPDTCSSWRIAAGVFNGTGIHGFADPSSLTNGIFVGKDAADADYKIMHNDGTGTATKVSTGIYASLTTMYKVRIFTTNGTSYTVTFTDLNTNTSYTATITTNIPSATTAVGPQISMQNNTSGTDDVAFDISKQLIIQQF